jgi:hypothetical protein
MDAFIGNDTGTMHMPALMGIPTIKIFSGARDRTDRDSDATSGEFWHNTIAMSCRGCVMLPLRWLPLRWVVIAAALALPTAATAHLQINQNFVTQGPAPSFGPIGTVQSADAPPNGNVAGAVGPVVADPLDANTLFVGTPAGGIWKTANGGTTWSPLTDKQASLSIASLSLDPTDPTRRTLIAGTGLTANGSVCSSGDCFFTGSGGLRGGLLDSLSGCVDTHEECFDLIRSFGGHILVAHNVQESFSGDGLLIASFFEQDRSLRMPPITRNTPAASLFPEP